MALKLKQRVLLSAMGVAVALIFLIQMNHFGALVTLSQLERRLPTNRLHSTHLLRRDVVDLQNSQVHLPVMRRDLDLSGYTSLEADARNLTDSKLLELLLNDRNLQKKGAIDGIIRIAHVLESYKTKRRRNSTSSDISATVGRNDAESRRGPVSAEADPTIGFLDPAVTERLSTIVRRMVAAHRKAKKRRGLQLSLYTKAANTSRLPAWKTFHNHISQYSLYDPKDPAIDEMLQDLVSQPIVKVYQHEGGTQLKLVFFLANNARVMWKPRRFPRDRETLPDHFYFNDYERFNAEIAAYQLDRVLGLHRVPPTTGRLINMTQDILRIADRKLAKTFFISPAGNVCFHGTCDYYCDTNHAVCGSPDVLEGSVSAFLPSTNVVERTTWRHPWRRSYSKHRGAVWEKYDAYCDTVRTKPPYNTGRLLLDIMDMAVFDFFTGAYRNMNDVVKCYGADQRRSSSNPATSTKPPPPGNMDRHHYETFEDFDNDTYPMILDNGRGFGKPRHDELSIMAPIYQCCLIRYSTLRRLLAIQQSQTPLSERMRQALARDKLAPILTDSHLAALDRRLNIVLQTLYNCILQHKASDVIVDDGF